MRGLKYQIMSLLKIKDYSQPKHFKTIYSGGKKRSKLKKKTIFRQHNQKHKESFSNKKRE